MRIGIDVRYLSHGLVGGVHTYLVNLVPALLDEADDHEIVLYADNKRPLELNGSHSEKVQIKVLHWKNQVSSLFLDFSLKKEMEKDSLDVVHFPANYGFGPADAAAVITLHDEINILPWFDIIKGHKKNVRTVMMMTYLHLCTKLSLRSAKSVITVSEYSRQQISHYSGIDKERIFAIPHAPTNDLKRITDPVVLDDLHTRYDIHKRFVLADGIKNPGVLVRAWDRLPESIRSEYEIIFFSRTPNPPDIVRQAEKAGVAKLLIRPPREDLIALYSLAEVFVFPSWIEGFGIPILEAMACGAPVIASDRGALPEVVGEAGYIISAEDDRNLSELLCRILSSQTETERLRRKGFERVAQFNWRYIAKKTLHTYEQAFERKSSHM
jgi:glycosyltransferase involved in cell wall biosynthesis